MSPLMRNGRPVARRQYHKEIISDPEMHPVYGLPLGDPVETLPEKGIPLCKWTEWGFPCAGDRGKLQVLDVQGIGRIWNATDLFSWGTAYLHPAYDKKGRAKMATFGTTGNKVSKQRTKLIKEEMQGITNHWVLGLLDPKKHTYKVRFPMQQAGKTYAFVSSRAAHFYFAQCMGRNFLRDPECKLARIQTWQRPELYAFRKQMIAQLFSILDSMPPEWTLFVKAGVVEFPSTSEWKLIYLYDTHKYDASGFEPAATKFDGTDAV